MRLGYWQQPGAGDQDWQHWGKLLGGMTNLDGLAKSTTGAYTKFLVLVIGCAVTFFVLNPQYLESLPKFAVAIIMMFTGGK